MARLKWWRKEEFGGKEKKLKELIKQLQRLRQSYMQYENGDEIKRVERWIHNMLTDEKIFWKQRSRGLTEDMDKNTKYFHYKASARKKKNQIWGIEDGSGS